MVEGLHANNANNFTSGNQTVNTLILSNNQIRTKGVIHLVSLIENDNNKGIKRLDLSSNMISDEGGILIANALCSNTSVTKFALKDNILKDGSGISFCCALK